MTPKLGLFDVLIEILGAQLLCSNQFPIVANPVQAPVGAVSIIVKSPEKVDP